MGYIFISYSHKDKDYVHKLQEALQNEGFEVWIDDRIDYGTRWPKVIQDRLDSCEAFIVVVSENSYESEWVQNEVTRAKRKRKPFFPLLLQGDPWLSVEATQYVDVLDGSLPTKKFYEHLSNYTARGDISIASSSPSINSVPIEPSDIEIEIKKKDAQRFLYLKRLYEKSNGNTLSYFHFTEIGRELGWQDEITDSVTDYLKDDGLIDFPSFGTVSITHIGIRFVEGTLKKPDFPLPKIPIEVDAQEIIHFFEYIESILDERFKTLENGGVTVQKSVIKGDNYSYQVRYKNNLVYHFSMRRDDGDNFRISFLDGWTEPITENASTAFGTIHATLDSPAPRIHITNLSLLETVIRSADLSYQELVEGIWSKACKVIEQIRKQLR